MARFNVTVYTSREQTEQGISIGTVTAISMVSDGLLTIEAESQQHGHGFTALHRFEPGKWTRYEVADVGGLT